MKDEFEYYDKKIEELTQLLSHAQSTTLKELISKSIRLTEQSLVKLHQTQKATIKYLSEHNDKTSQKLLNYKNQMYLLNQRKFLLDAIPNNIPVKTPLVNQFLADSDTFQKKANFEAQHNDLVLDTFTKCEAEIERTLLEFIVKPSNNKFRYEQVIDILNFIVSNFSVPGLDGINMVSKFSIISKKKAHIDSGDKIILYIEQYNDVLEKWYGLCDGYIKITKS